MLKDQAIIKKDRESKKELIGGIIVFVGFFGGAFYVLISSIINNILFYIIAFGYIVITSWLLRSRDLDDGKGVLISMLIFGLILTVYALLSPYRHYGELLLP